MNRPALLSLALVLLASGCDEASRKASNVVEAASQATADGLARAAQALEEAGITPEAARATAQQLVDRAAEELREVRESETAARILAVVDGVLTRVGELGEGVADALELDALGLRLRELSERFRDDPRVQRALESVRREIDELTR
jgi:hypothetical protein